MHLLGSTGLSSGTVHEPSHATPEEPARYEELQDSHHTVNCHGMARFTYLLHFSFTLTAEKADNPFDEPRIRNTVRCKTAA